MKCRIVTWEEIPIKEFCARYPSMAAMLPKEIDLSDEDYIVRLDRLRGLMEVGYRGDDNWRLK